jgi:hypothetical protein
MFTLQDVESRYGSDESAWLHLQIITVLESGDWEYMDNVRLALVGDSELEQHYERIRDDGCCGSCDHRFGPSPSGRFYMYGFNYGH